MSNKTTQIAARVRVSERDDLRKIAETLDIPEAQIVREAVREKIAELKGSHPKLQTDASGQDADISLDK